ncbi:Phosphate-binding protein pstS precursor [uncultured Clostridium sp.]|uniref:phosphate ABC transporter substrate-binding protein n=1 Tax=Flintibacter sp. HCN-6482 TaxID=3134672 RepID=UPI000821B1FA|nr:phosphate ABC transporter substrate-binding protein [Clostridiales bacterium]SCG90858.1 Phosphate-binding protein pstS precursor [uncultured Clostridium sp.]
MKKLTCLGLALVMALSLTACGGNNNSSSNSNGTGNSNTGSAAGAQSTDNNTQTDLSGSVTTNGSTSMEKVVLTLNEQFMIDHPDVKASYDPTGSSTGIEAAKNGSADIGLASRALKDEEVADGLKSTTLALDGIAIIVNADSAISDLTVEQIAQIFKGEVTNWSEMGGADGAIACIGREGGSGTRDGFESITGTEDLCVLSQELTSTGAVIEAVKNNPQAIGYASLSAVEGQEGIKAITVNGVACSEETVLDGSYEIQRPFILVTKEGETLSEAAQAWFDWATSAAASDLIRAAGAVPMV